MRFKPRYAAWFLIGGILVPLSLGGCNVDCDCDDNDVEDVVEDIGDEVRDTVKEVED